MHTMDVWEDSHGRQKNWNQIPSAEVSRALELQNSLEYFLFLKTEAANTKDQALEFISLCTAGRYRGQAAQFRRRRYWHFRRDICGM